MIYKFDIKMYKLQSELTKQNESILTSELDKKIMNYCKLSYEDKIYKNDKFDSLVTMLSIADDAHCQHNFAIVSCERLVEENHEFPVMLQFLDSYYLPCNYVLITQENRVRAACCQDNRVWFIEEDYTNNETKRTFFKSVDDFINSGVI